MLKALPPKDVEEAFKDVNSAKQDQVRYKQQAREYANKVIPEARGDAQAIIERAKAYRDQTVKEAEGEASRFEKVFSEYEKAPEITRKRMFLETMERVFGGTDKIIIDNKGAGGSGVVPYLPLNEMSKKRAGGTQ